MDIVKFDKFIEDGIKEKYSSQPKDHQVILLKSNHILRFDLVRILELYEKSKYYKSHSDEFMRAMASIKLEIFFIEIDLSAWNRMADHYVNTTSYWMTIRASLNQSIILKSRVMLERLMFSIYFLETGEKLNLISIEKRKDAFWGLVASTDWEFLNEHRAYFDWYDKKLRNPEQHSKSPILDELMGSTAINDSNIMAMYEIVINLFYPNMVCILEGLPPAYRVWTLGQDVST